MKVTRDFGRLHGVMIQGCVSRTDEVPPGITEIRSRMLTHFSTFCTTSSCEIKSASTLKNCTIDFSLSHCIYTNQTPLTLRHEHLNPANGAFPFRNGETLKRRSRRHHSRKHIRSILPSMLSLLMLLLLRCLFSGGLGGGSRGSLA